MRRSDKCLCAPEFTGPHCEFLRAYHDHNPTYFIDLLNDDDSDDERSKITSPSLETNTINDTSSDDDDEGKILTGIFSGIGLLGVAGIGVILFMRKSRRGGRGSIAAISQFESDHSLSLSPSSSVSLVQSADLDSTCTYPGMEVVHRHEHRQGDWPRVGTQVRSELFHDNIAMERLNGRRIVGKKSDDDEYEFRDVVL